VVGELGIAAPRTKFDDDGNLLHAATASEITALVDTLVDASAATSGELVNLTIAVVEALGIDAAHVPPAT
jgi:hypothetical protein